jgi:hypothetical protein
MQDITTREKNPPHVIQIANPYVVTGVNPGPIYDAKIRCYTRSVVFDIDRKKDREEAIKHSRACHEMTQGFRAYRTSQHNDDPG